MLSWLWKNGNTKTEKLPEEPKANNTEKAKKVNKYKSLLKKYKDSESQLVIMNDTVLELLREQDAVKMLLFAIVIQHGGKLEVTKDTLKLTEETQSEYDLEFLNQNGNLVYLLKRKEPTS